MKPIIFVAFLFTFFGAKAQGKFVQSTYTNYSRYCSVISVTEQDFIMNIYSDSSVILEISIKYYGDIFNQYSFTHSFLGAGTFNGDTLTIAYKSSSSAQTTNKQLKRKNKYMPAPNERIYNPPSVFVIKGETIKDINSDFPTLNKVSPALAMNMQNRNTGASFLK